MGVRLLYIMFLFYCMLPNFTRRKPVLPYFGFYAKLIGLGFAMAIIGLLTLLLLGQL